MSDYEQRFGGIQRLYGTGELAKLRRAHVCVVGIGGVVIENGRALLIRRGAEPLRGQWSIPGGTLELGESLQ